MGLLQLLRGDRKTKTSSSLLRKSLSVGLAVAMVVGSLGDFGGISVKADETGASGSVENGTYTFDVSTDADIAGLLGISADYTMTEDKSFVDGFYLLSSGGEEKGWKIKPSSSKNVINSQNAANYIGFTIPSGKKATVKYTISATGNANYGGVGLLKNGDTTPVETTEIEGTSQKNVEVTNVTSGTYKLCGSKTYFTSEAPSDATCTKKGDTYRLYSISVEITDSDILDDLANPDVTVVPGDTKLTVKWDEVAGAESYTVDVKNGEESVYNTTVASTEEASYSKEVIGLTNGTSYTVTVTATNTQGNPSGVTTVTGTPVTIGSGYVYTNIDLSAGLVKGTTYGDPAVATVEVLENMGYDTTKGATIDGIKYAGSIQGTTNPTVSGNTATGGAAFVIRAVRDGKISFVTKSAGKAWVFATDSAVIDSGESVAQGLNEFNITAGNTYYYYAKGSKLTVCAIAISAGTPTVDWDSIANPSITSVEVDEANSNQLNINYSANISSAAGNVAGEYLTVEVYEGTDTTGESVATLTSRAQGESGTLTYSPSESGSYTFKPILKRTGCDDKVGETSTFAFTLPLKAPVISAISQGGGTIRVSWDAVAEATGYDVYVDGAKQPTTTETSVDISDLTVGQKYTFKVIALRNTEESAASSEVTETATQEAKIEWKSAVFGNGADSSKASINATGDDLGHDDTSTVTIVAGKKDGTGKFSSNCGKLQSTGTDGLVFYYTKIPAETNFTLNATAHVNQWRYSNGQEGFGLMASDAVYNTSGDYWYNSYMADVTKVEYYYDSDTDKVTDSTDATKISMKLGVGAQEKIGVTAANKNNFSVANDLKYGMYTLDTSCASMGSGTYNLVGSIEDASELGTTVNSPALTSDFNLTLQKNNTGYFISYIYDGKTETKKFYDPNALSMDAEGNVYVGFFASRYVDVTFKNVSLTTIAASEDAAAEERPIEYVTPNCKVISEKTSNSSAYTLVYYANADGKLTVKDASGNVLVNNESITHAMRFEKVLTLSEGSNSFEVTFTPDEGYRPDGNEYKQLSSYDPVSETFSVTYDAITGEDGKIYVSPTGSSANDGTKANPVDIYTAVKYVSAGQTIVLTGGTYNLSSTVTVPRGNDGTADNMIYMIADPDSATRPVFDFGQKCAGMVFAGNYWYVKGFDVTNSANGQKGIQVSGSHCTFELINTYYNGNTGLQVSRYLGSDDKALWPSYDTILNCTSYCNADSGYEDADGFAAKLTVGDGIVFDGCISHHNADDGWDLFAKVATGSIGAVTIKNSVAYANGYWINRSGETVDAGNGNGFKMGGDSLAGGHTLINSVSYDNKAKGIDSNSCPDIKVVNCTSFNNGSYNVALYTNSAKNTDFEVTGLASFRTTGLDIKEQFKTLGTQDMSKINKSVNYYWDATSKTSKNVDGDTCTAEWFMSTDTNNTPTRNADGSINMHTLLVLTDVAKQGAKINTSATTGAPNASANSDSGNSGSNGGTGAGSSSDDYDSSDDDSSSDSSSSGSTGSTSSPAAGNTSATPSETIEGTTFATNTGINSNAAGIISVVKEDGTVPENVTVAADDESLKSAITAQINTTAKSITVYAAETTVIGADTMKELDASGKTLSVGVVSASGSLTAIITIDGSKLTGTPVDFNVEVKTGTDAGANAIKIVNIAGNMGIAISFRMKINKRL